MFFINFNMFCRIFQRFEIAITFDGDVLRSSRLNRWKAESQGFPSVQTRAPEDITIKSYGDFEIHQNFMKIKEIMQNPLWFLGFLWFSWNFQNQRPKLEIAITFDGYVHFRRLFNQWKVEIQGFPSVEESSKMDITIKSYGDFKSLKN